MTLTARIEVGEDIADRAPFPGPDRTVAPRVLDLAATYLLNEDYGVNARYVYPSIGFDGKAALALEAMDRRAEIFITLADGEQWRRNRTLDRGRTWPLVAI